MQSGVGAVGGWGVEGKEMPGANRAPAESNPSGPKGVDGSRQDLSKRQSGSDGKKICLQCRRLGFDLWVEKIPWKRKWQPTPLFLPGEFHGQRTLACYSPPGPKESDMTDFHFTAHNWTF